MPYWPIRLSEDQAALFVGISKTAFRNKWSKQKTYPQPVREGGRLLWHRRQLEGFVDAQFGLTQSPGAPAGDDTWDDLN